MRSLSTISLALVVGGCTTTPTITTVYIPASALAPKPMPALEGTSNRSVGIYAIECRAALESLTNDMNAVRKSINPP